jgi:hypothetical protein
MWRKKVESVFVSAVNGQQDHRELDGRKDIKNGFPVFLIQFMWFLYCQTWYKGKLWIAWSVFVNYPHAAYVNISCACIWYWNVHTPSESWGSSVSTVAKLLAGRPGFDPLQRQRSNFCSPPHPDSLWGPPNHLVSGYWRLFALGGGG